MKSTKQPSIQTIIAIMATITSLCALSISAYQAYMNRKQVYASVMPSLMISGKIVENSKFENKNSFNLSLENKGVGPAIIEEATYNVDGKTYKNIGEIVENNFNVQNYSTNSIWKNRIFSANEKIEIVSAEGIFGKEITSYFKTKNMKISIKYASIYGEKWLLEYNNFSEESNKTTKLE